MSGHRPWAEIRRSGTSEAEQHVAAETRIILRENALAKLRQHEPVTQGELAAALGTAQVNIAHTEHEDEPRLSTVRQFVEALGGTLTVQVHIGDETIDVLTRERNICPSAITRRGGQSPRLASRARVR